MVKNLPANAEDARDMGWIPGSGRSPGEGNDSSILAWREFHGQRSLVGYIPWGSKELDTTEQLTLTFLGDGASLVFIPNY